MSIATRFATSSDGTSIAYDVCGGGCPIVLLHGGYIQDRRSWHEAGYVTALAHEFRVIAVDLRGHGESDAPDVQGAYTMGKIVGDVLSVADACAAERFLLWGFSLGGTVALHLAARSPRPLAIVVAGSFFGKLLDQEHVDRVVQRLEKTVTAKEHGHLDTLGLSPAERWFAERANLRVVLALTLAGLDWPAIEPADLRCPAYLYAGSKNSAAVAALDARRQAISACGVQVRTFDTLDHLQEFHEAGVIFPEVRSFLNTAGATRR